MFTAALASLTVFALLASAIFISNTDDFRTLGTKTREATPVVQIVFSPTTSEALIRKILYARDNRLISGPSRHGVYRVGVSSIETGERFVDELALNPHVMFAELETP